MDEATWRRRTGPVLFAASIAFLLAYSWRVITAAGGSDALVTNIVIIVTWAAFAADYLVRLAIAPHKWAWFRRHLPDLAITLIPVLRLVRVARILTRLPGVQCTHASALRTRILVYGLASASILIYIASLQVLDAERGAAGATITSFGEALWWACVTATTTGFGDLTPVTLTGRIVGVVLMFGGVALAGVITATLASWVFERGAMGDDSADAATRGDLRALQAEIAALRSSLDTGDSEGGEGASVP